MCTLSTNGCIKKKKWKSSHIPTHRNMMPWDMMRDSLWGEANEVLFVQTIFGLLQNLLFHSLEVVFPIRVREGEISEGDREETLSPPWLHFFRSIIPMSVSSPSFRPQSEPSLSFFPPPPSNACPGWSWFWILTGSLQGTTACKIFCMFTLSNRMGDFLSYPSPQLTLQRRNLYKYFVYSLLQME